MKLFNPFRRLKKPDPPQPAHVHSWKPIAVREGTAKGYPATNILQQCGCGEYHTQAAYGHWSLEQVSAGELSKDVQELKRMASL